MLKKTLNIRGVGFHIADRIDEKTYAKWEKIYLACFVRSHLFEKSRTSNFTNSDTLRMMLDCYFEPQKIIKENVGLFWKEAKKKIKNETITTNEQVLNYLFDYYYQKNTDEIQNNYALRCQLSPQIWDNNKKQYVKTFDKSKQKEWIKETKKTFSA